MGTVVKARPHDTVTLHMYAACTSKFKALVPK